MAYLVLRVRDNKIIKQFKSYEEAWDYCLEVSQKELVRLVEFNTQDLKLEGVTTF